MTRRPTLRTTWRLPLLLLALAGPAAAQDVPGKMRLWTEGQALTRAAPTLVTEGLPLRDVTGYRVSVCAASGQTLSGAGTLQAYVWDNDTARWMRNPGLDVTVSASAVRCQAFPDFETLAPSGRVLYAAASVTVSSGTVTVAVKARVKP